MRSAAALTIALATGALAAPASSVVALPQVASVAADGTLGAGPARGAALSASGRFLAFTSADPLAGTPTGVRQVYVRDRQQGTTLLASSTAAGVPADAPVDDPADRRAYAISGDGRYVVFASTAANLDPADADGGERDVFRKDLVTGAVVTVSRAPGGGQADDGVAGDPDISSDGARVAYETGPAGNLWPGDASSVSDIVVWDATAGASLASAGPAGIPLAGPVGRPSINGDGSVVAFEHDGSVAVRDMATAATANLPGPGGHPDVSEDGRVVAHTAGSGVVRHDRATSLATAVAAVGAAPALSADGSRVAFESAAALTPADVNGVGDVYVWRAGTVARQSERPDRTGVSRPSTRPDLSGDGSVAAFGLDDGAPSESLAAGDANGQPDVLVSPVPSGDTGPVPPKARARALTVFRAGRSTFARFTLDRGAVRVSTRVWRRVVRSGASPGWTPVTVGRGVTPAAGRRRVLVRRVPLAAGAYQLRVAVVSGGGVAVAILRFSVPRRPSGR